MIAVLGPANSYCHLAAHKAHPKQKIAFFPTITQVFNATEQENVMGFVPVENILHGSVRETYACLTQHKLAITAAYDLPIHHCLASRSRTYSSVMSHPQALAQCQKFLSKKNLRLLESASTSAAMAYAVKHSAVAAIGSQESARANKLTVLARNIEDNPLNVTRFIQLEKKPKKTGSKTTLLLNPHNDKPGLLYDILGAFREQNINLSKIESYPSGARLGEYTFIIDVDVSGKRVDAAINDLRTLASVHSFGSYEVKKLGK